MPDTRIVCFLNSAYARIGQNWLAAMDRLGLRDRLLLVTLDDEAAELFASVATLHRPFIGGLGGLWAHRTRVIAELVADGCDVLHSDADAVWLRNPLSEHFNGEEDLSFSQGTIWPPDSLAAKGFVVCCGLFLMRATHRARALLPDWLALATSFGDDQIAMNRLIDRMFPKWTIARAYQRSYHGHTYLCSDEKMTAEANGLRISVLPYDRFPRIAEDYSGAYVAHPLSPKSAVETEACLRSAGLWLI